MKPFLSVLCGIACALCASLSMGEVIAIQGGKVVSLGRAGTLDVGTVLIADGKIAAVGRSVAVPPGARVLDATGKVVTPGLVAPLSILGLVDVNLEPSTRDYKVEHAGLNAAFEVSHAINPRSPAIAIARREGVTRAAVTPLPGDGIFAGFGALVQLIDADRIVTHERAFAFVALGERGRAIAGGSRGAALIRLKLALRAASKSNGETLPAEATIPPLDLEALRPVASGKVPLVIAVDRASDISEVIALAEEFPAVDIVLFGAAEAWLVADALARANIAVIIDAYANLPTSFDDLAATRQNAKRLSEAGVLVSFTTGASEYHPPLESLTQMAGNAVAHGLPWIEAMKAITVHPARIFHVEKEFGALDPGLSADLVVWDGDPLEVMTNADHVFIAGREVSLQTRQTRLRERYRNLADPHPPAYR